MNAVVKTMIGICSAMLLGSIIPETTEAVCTVSLRGSASSVIKLNIVDFGAPDNGIQSIENSGGATASITFGDKVGERGSHARANFGLQIKSNCPYAVRMSRTNWTVNNLDLDGREVSAADRGSFIRIAANGVSASGGGATIASTSISPSLQGSGMALSEVTEGPVTPNSTLVAQGARTSLSGGLGSLDNNVVIHMAMHCANGERLSAHDKSAPGMFQTTLQFQAFPQRP